MHGQEHILRERFSQDRCGACGVTQREEDVIILAHRGPRWLVLLTCWRCQRRGIFIATFPRNGQLPVKDAHPLASQTPPLNGSQTADEQPSVTSLTLPSSDTSPISLSDVDAMRRFLLGFNGDFHTLFGSVGGDVG